MIYNKVNIVLRSTIKMIFIVSSLMFISSCTTDNSDIVPSADVRISFDPPVMKGITRAVVPDYEHGAVINKQPTAYHKDEKFMVFGVKYTKGTVANNIPWATKAIYVQPDNSAKGAVASYDPSVNGWDTQKHQYWAKDKNIVHAFKAYSPSDLKDHATTVRYWNEGTNKGLEDLFITGYKTPDIGKQFDLMFAKTVYDVQGPTPKQDDNGNAFYSGVNLEFVHALSSVHFYVRMHPDYMAGINTEDNRRHEASHYSIKSIVLKGVKDKADFQEWADYTPNPNTYVLNTTKPFWTNIITTTNPNTREFDFVDPNSPVTDIPYQIVSGDIEAEDIKTLNQYAHIGFMIPQALTDEAQVVVTWTYDDGTIKTDTEKTFPLKPLTDEWKMGMRYVYTISLSNDFIEFDPSAGAMTNNDIEIK